MAKKLYVGNLSYNTQEEDLREAFSKIGEVLSATLIIDQASGRSKGFGFVEMAQDEDAAKAIATLNGTSFMDRTITVNEAKPKTERSGSAAAGVIAADTVEEEDRGDKSPVTEHRKGPAGPEEEDPGGRPYGGNKEAPPLRKAVGEKEEQAARGREAKTEAPEALTTAIRFGAEAGKAVAVIRFIAQLNPDLTRE